MNFGHLDHCVCVNPISIQGVHYDHPNRLCLTKKKSCVYAPAGKTPRKKLVNFPTKQQTVGEQMSESCAGKSFSDELIVVHIL